MKIEMMITAYKVQLSINQKNKPNYSHI